METINYYEFLGPSIIYKNQLHLAEKLFGLRRNTPDEYASVNPISGFFYYTNRRFLGKARYRLPFYSREMVKALSDKLLKGFEQNISGLKQLKGLLPFDQLKFIDASLIGDPQKGSYDHWLCQYVVEVPLGDGGKAEVKESLIQLRINPALQVGSLFIRWKPIIKTFRSALIVKESEHEHHPETDEPDSRIVYCLDNESRYQKFLLPYYESLSGHHSNYLPAMDLSFSIDMETQKGRRGTIVRAVVTGGSGEFEYNWAYWRPELVWEAGIVELGTQPEISLDVPAMYNLMVKVKDKKSGIIKEFHKHIFTSPETVKDISEEITNV